jgi:hypothetical protein
MSNIFKTNSRFASLMDDNSVQQKKSERKNERRSDEVRNDENNGENKFNLFKCEKNGNQFREMNQKERENRRMEKEKQDKIKKENAEREKEIKTQELLNINNFPELAVIKKTDTINEKKISYLEKIQTEDKKEDIIVDPDLVNLKPGWVLIKKDPITGKTIMKNHPDNTKYLFKEREKTDNEIANDIINSLVELHEKRTQEYIELNGYDTWEKMFKFPNWQEEDYSDSEDESEEEENFDTDENDEYYN